MTSWPNIGKGLRRGARVNPRRPGYRATSRPVRCNAPHPMHPRQVRCESVRGHAGEHFHSFYQRSWES